MLWLARCFPAVFPAVWFANHNGQTAIDGQLQDPAMAVSAGPAGYGTEGEITDTEHVRLLLSF